MMSVNAVINKFSASQHDASFFPAKNNSLSLDGFTPHNMPMCSLCHQETIQAAL